MNIEKALKLLMEYASLGHVEYNPEDKDFGEAYDFIESIDLPQLLREIASAGVVIDIPHKYVEVQIDHLTWERVARISGVKS